MFLVVCTCFHVPSDARVRTTGAIYGQPISSPSLRSRPTACSSWFFEPRRCRCDHRKKVNPLSIPPRRERSAESALLTCERHASNYDNTEMFFQEAKAYMDQLPHSSSINSFDSIPSRRSSSTSWVSNYTQNTIPSPVSATFSHRSKPSNPSLQRDLIFKRLPQEVYDCILEQLQELHSDRLSPSCTTCYLRDLVALQLTSRSWDKGVRKTL